PDTWNVESNSIKTCFRAQVKGFAVPVSPSHVVGMLRTDDRSEVFTFRRNYPEPTRSGEIEVSALVHLHAVPGVVTRLGGGVKKDLPICKGAVRQNFVTHDDFSFEIPVI